MRIIQMLSTIAYGDAVSNDTIAMEKIIKEMGYVEEEEYYLFNILESLWWVQTSYWIVRRLLWSIKRSFALRSRVYD